MWILFHKVCEVTSFTATILDKFVDTNYVIVKTSVWSPLIIFDVEPYQKPFESEDKFHPLVTIIIIPTLILFLYSLVSLLNTIVLLETCTVNPLLIRKPIDALLSFSNLFYYIIRIYPYSMQKNYPSRFLYNMGQCR